MHLGNHISEKDIETGSHKIKVIRDWTVPNTYTEVSSFLGFTNHYPHFIYKYVQVAQPLYKLISGDNASKKNRVMGWNEEYEEAFWKLKIICTSTPIFTYAHFRNLFNFMQMHAFWN